ncbi:MAG TPA: discoidin domain-containing protein [Ignavibacteriaceae bacterium]|nr:discoidin domain-containing protein [Ignavibacteriaceae bacterium]
MKNLILIFFILFMLVCSSFSQTVLDDFESVRNWKIYKSDGVEANVKTVEGHTGKCIRFDYEFTKGTGYGGIQKIIPLNLPGNYQFTFYIKAESPANNLEFKLLDSTGQNVWWTIEKNYDFPSGWTKIKIKKRHISFAWGPAEDQTLKRIDRLEFTISSNVGGKGSIWIDDLEFEPLPPEDTTSIIPAVSASSELVENPAKNMTDNNPDTEWKSGDKNSQKIILDFTKRREFGGIVIDWDAMNYAKDFDIYLADGNKEWRKIYSVKGSFRKKSYIRLKEEDADKVKIDLKKSSQGNGFGIKEISIKNVDYSADINRFFINIAKDSHRGYFPRYFNEEGTYWTIIGVDSDQKEAMINEDGMIETDKKHFSIEPFLFLNDKLITWNDVQKQQQLEKIGTPYNRNSYLPIPSVTWNYDNLNLVIKTFSAGVANQNSVLYIIYTLVNTSVVNKKGTLFLAVRPFQVNPYYQWLNLTGGVSEISSIKYENEKILVNDDKTIIPVTKEDSFGAAGFDEGDITTFLELGKVPGSHRVNDVRGFASGCLSYSFELEKNESKKIYIAVPFYKNETGNSAESFEPSLKEEAINKYLDQTISFWENKVNHIKFNLPQSADRIINTYRSNLAYILINKDYAGIQPGSRSYERSWIRDGALTSSALLKSGIIDEVKDFINWYTANQYENGKVPCVVDTRGPDPVSENDSHGEMIYLIKEYFNFTKDTSFLRTKNENVLRAVDYMKSLIAQRSTDHFKDGNDSVRAYYGIMPESISHEGYSAKPMHSYWDDFFTLKGLKDAAEIQKILGEDSLYKKVKAIRDIFKKNLYNSINLAIKTRKVDYIPGCVELGDFDATSTTIAISPCNELANLPQPYTSNTFDKYFEFFENRRDNKIDWTAYTPYENRLIGSFIFLDEPQRAHELIKFFLGDQRPQGWNHWAEVVWKNKRYPGYIGDMPHTWVGSDFINAVRSIFVYENEYDSSIVTGAGLYRDWVDSPSGMSVENLPTYYGELSYSIKKNENKYDVKFYGNITLPPGGIVLKNFITDQKPVSVYVNHKSVKEFDKRNIRINEFPALVEVSF